MQGDTTASRIFVTRAVPRPRLCDCRGQPWVHGVDNVLFAGDVVMTPRRGDLGRCHESSGQLGAGRGGGEARLVSTCDDMTTGSV